MRGERSADIVNSFFDFHLREQFQCFLLLKKMIYYPCYEFRSMGSISLRKSKRKEQKMTTPKPGKPVRGSQTGRPIMALLDLLGRRWTLRILWELREGSLGFRALQGRCDNMSPSVLSKRLLELQEAEIVRQNEKARYALTREGIALLHSLASLNEWALRWAERLRRQE